MSSLISADAADTLAISLPAARPPLIGLVGLVSPEILLNQSQRLVFEHGSRVLLIPAAFTRPTGEAHWHTLLRARAIENLAYVIAPAQVGTHFPGRRSYGHTLIVSPWGELLADAGGEGEGFVTARVEPAEITRVRTMLPALSHRRL